MARDTVIGRAGRALYDHVGREDKKLIGWPSWDDLTDDIRNEWIGMARAVLVSARDAGNTAVFSAGIETGDNSFKALGRVHSAFDAVMGQVLSGVVYD